MNDVYSMQRKDIKSGIGVYVIDGIGENSVDRAKLLLAGISHGADKAIGSAIKRAASSGEAFAARHIREEYYIKAADFKAYTKSKRHIVTDNDGTTVTIDFTGFHIPLLKFDTKIGKDGRVVTRVKRGGSKTVLDHVFAQTVGTHGHRGIFERKTSLRFPIEEKMGPSTPQMMSYNDDVSQAIGDHVRETFEKRLDHEIEAIMNGRRR